MSAPREPVSIREFARLDGCNDKLVRRAISVGKLAVDENGKLDPALAGSGWRKSNRRDADIADKPAAKASKGVRAAVPKRSAPVRTRRKKVDQVPPADGEDLFSEEVEDFLSNLLNGKYATTGEAERIKENALAAKHLLAARKEAGGLIEMELAEKVLFDVQRSQRNAWLNFPSRIGPLLAAELGLEADAVLEALTAHVYQQLTDLGEPDPEFGGGSQA